MRKESFEEKLSRLQSIAGGPVSDDAVGVLRDALSGSSGVLAALAAEIAGHRRIIDLAPDLVRAFDRFMVDTDKGCQVKTAVVDALHRMDARADDIYLRGIKHVQMEPAFGGPVDTAENLRAGCAIALASMRHPQAAFELTNLLVDPLANPRRAAVKGLAHLGGDEAELLIHLKSLIGDSEPDVMGECFNALMMLDPHRSIKSVGEFLRSSNTVIAEQAALALGQSHEAEAFEMLREHWENNFNPEFRQMLLLPIALLRRDEAFMFLLDVVQNAGSGLAAEAVTALGLYADDDSRAKIQAVVKKRDDKLVSEAFKREFGAIDPD